MSDKLKRSNTDLTLNSNIVTLDNLEDVGENFFRRTQPKGKVFKGPNWTAYNKENLGSIPREVEKALVEDKKGMTKIGFSTQSERFFPKNENVKLTPGVGSYNISGDLDFTRTGTSFYSSKGFGNGFASKSERFNDSSLYYSKYSVGPSDYDPQHNGSIADNISKTMMCKSLYNNKKTRSLKVKPTTPGPCTYNPIMNTFDARWRAGKLGGENAVFKSNVKRFITKKKNSDALGPGKYFRDEEFVDFNENSKPSRENYFFKSPHVKNVDLLQKYEIKTKQIPEDAKFKLVSQKGRVINNSSGMGVFGDFNFMSVFKNPYAITKKDIYKLRNKTFIGSKNEEKKDKPLYEQQLIIANGGVTSEQGMEYIHKILHKPEKPDLFKLNAPRWKVNELLLKVPGPAYYHPKNQPKALSFNRCNKPGVFIVTPGVSNPEDDDPIADNF